MYAVTFGSIDKCSKSLVLAFLNDLFRCYPSTQLEYNPDESASTERKIKIEGIMEKLNQHEKVCTASMLFVT